MIDPAGVKLLHDVAGDEVVRDPAAPTRAAASSSGRSPATYDQYRGTLRVVPRRRRPTVTVVNDLPLETLPPRRRPGRDAVDRGRPRRSRPRRSRPARTRPAGSDRASPTTTSSTTRARRSTAARSAERATTNAVIAATAGVDPARAARPIANTLFHSTGGGATENNENVYTSATGDEGRRRGQLPARLDGPARPTAPRTTRPPRTPPGDCDATRRAQLSAWFAADPRTDVGTLTALDLRDSRRLRPAHQASRSSGRDGHEDRVGRGLPVGLQRRRGRPAIRCCGARSSTTDADPLSRYRGGVIERRPRCCVGRRRPARSRSADGRLPRRRVGHAGPRRHRAVRAARARVVPGRACRGRRSCASARRSGRRSAASIRGSWPPSTTRTASA